MKIKMIDNKRHFLRFWSVRLGLAGTAMTGVLVGFPDVALQAWSAMPPELSAAIPARYMPMIGVGFFVLSILARGLKQKYTDEDEK